MRLSVCDGMTQMNTEGGTKNKKKVSKLLQSFCMKQFQFQFQNDHNVTSFKLMLPYKVFVCMYTSAD